MLEDDSGRIRLAGMETLIPIFVTGVVIAVLGSVNEHGAFQVR